MKEKNLFFLFDISGEKAINIPTVGNNLKFIRAKQFFISWQKDNFLFKKKKIEMNRERKVENCTFVGVLISFQQARNDKQQIVGKVMIQRCFICCFGVSDMFQNIMPITNRNVAYQSALDYSIRLLQMLRLTVPFLPSIFPIHTHTHREI